MHGLVEQVKGKPTINGREVVSRSHMDSLPKAKAVPLAPGETPNPNAFHAEAKPVAIVDNDTFDRLHNQASDTKLIDTLEEQTRQVKSSLPKPIVAIAEPFIKLTQGVASTLASPLINLARPYLEKLRQALVEMPLKNRNQVLGALPTDLKEIVQNGLEDMEAFEKKKITFEPGIHEEVVKMSPGFDQLQNTSAQLKALKQIIDASSETSRATAA
jgi:hypothetical protein